MLVPQSLPDCQIGEKRAQHPRTRGEHHANHSCASTARVTVTTATAAAAKLPVGSALQAGTKLISNTFTVKTIFDAGVSVGAAYVCLKER